MNYMKGFPFETLHDPIVPCGNGDGFGGGIPG